MVIVGDFVPNLFSVFMRVEGVTLFPFIFVRDGSNRRLINHEQIHLAQFKELWIFGFLWVYVTDFLLGLIKYRNARKAYLMIRLEQEAYYYDDNLNYLRIRENKEWRGFHV